MFYIGVGSPWISNITCFTYVLVSLELLERIVNFDLFYYWDNNRVNAFNKNIWMMFSARECYNLKENLHCYNNIVSHT